MLRTAVVLCVAALCCLSPFCQAFPQLWSDELAREEEGRVAAVDALRSVARALIEQNSEGINNKLQIDYIKWYII